MNTIFITGGSTGIGAATVRKFLAKGWNVSFIDKNLEAADEFFSSLSNDDLAHLHFTLGDTRIKSDLEEAAAATVKRFGGINALFCNAGIHRCNTMLNVTDEEFDLVVKTNIYGTVNTLKAITPHIINANGGSIVINASDQWFVGKPDSFVYGLTKGALGQITRSLSIDLGKYNIRVNAVCAGTIRTPLVDNLFKDFAEINHCTVEDYWKAENKLYARGLAGKPEEVANLVFFLASDEASFCTGGHFLCDGGLVAR